MARDNLIVIKMEDMEAVVVEGIGNLDCKRIPYPECRDNDVIVSVKVSGICSTDVSRAMKTGFYHYPIVPGHEFCGTIIKKGKNVGNVDVDDRVVIYPLIPCKKCRSCISGDFNLCENYDFLGSRSNGGHEEYVRCPSENVIKIPDNVTFEEASLVEPSSVALHANKIAGHGSIVVVMGLGPIGNFAAQWARFLGAEQVIGVDRNDNKFDIARKVGIREFVDRRSQNVSQTIKNLTGGQGADIIFECSGSDELQKESILSTSRHGKIVIMGNPTQDLVLSKDVFSLILRREINIAGSWSSLISEKEWNQSLEGMGRKNINALPVLTHNFHISEAKKVIEDMYHKNFDFLKVGFRM